MATRQQIQIAQDLVRIVNIMNDLLDDASYALKGINVSNGQPLMVTDTPIDQTPINRAITIPEKIDRAKRAGLNIQGYHQTISDFIQNYGEKNVEDALMTVGVSYVDIRTDIAAMKAEADKLTVLKGDESTLELTSASIDANIPKLPLVRRRGI